MTDSHHFEIAKGSAAMAIDPGQMLPIMIKAIMQHRRDMQALDHDLKIALKSIEEEYRTLTQSMCDEVDTYAVSLKMANRLINAAREMQSEELFIQASEYLVSLVADRPRPLEKTIEYVKHKSTKPSG